MSFRRSSLDGGLPSKTPTGMKSLKHTILRIWRTPQHRKNWRGASGFIRMELLLGEVEAAIRPKWNTHCGTINRRGKDSQDEESSPSAGARPYAQLCLIPPAIPHSAAS